MKQGTLKGIKVLDLSRQLAGPFCTMTLADMGAEVIKVEDHGKGDDSRSWGPFTDGESCYFMSANRGKRSIVVDMKSEKGREIIKTLAAQSDVIIENFRTGVTERLGIDYSVLSKINPGIVYCHITGFGEDGPDANRAGVDNAIQAYTGLISITGYEGMEPVRIGVSLCDLATGVFALSGILSALYARKETGCGQKVSCSLIESMVSWLSYHAVGYLSEGKIPGKWGSGMENIEPYRAFKTKDGYVMVGVGNDTNWRRLCEVMENTELSKDERFSTNPKRMENKELLLSILNEYFLQQENKIIEAKIVEKGIPCSAVKNIAETLSSPQVVHRKMVMDMEHPRIKGLKLLRTPIDFSEGTNYTPKHPPLHGEDTIDVLKEMGYTEEFIQQAIAENVVAQGSKV